MKNYPLLDVRVSTPTLELRGATDELLDQLAEVVRAGKTHADPAPYDDPMSFYEPDPDLRVAKWLRCDLAAPRQRRTGCLAAVLRGHGRRPARRGADAYWSELLRCRNGHHLLVAVYR